jgi:hypothetical protein
VATSVSAPVAAGKKVASTTSRTSGSKRKAPAPTDSTDDDYSPPKHPRPEPESPEQVFDDEGQEQVDETEAGKSLVS